MTKNIVEETAYEYLRTDLRIPEIQARLISGKLGICADNWMHMERERVRKIVEGMLVKSEKELETNGFKVGYTEALSDTLSALDTIK